MDLTSDPFTPYIARAGLKSGPRFINSRFCHTPGSLRTLGHAINVDWQELGLIPAGYQFSICPPTAFNLIGLLFHREWSETATLELSAHFDDRGNAWPDGRVEPTRRFLLREAPRHGPGLDPAWIPSGAAAKSAVGDR